MKRYAAAFPTIDAPFIDELRARHDPLAHVVAPHVTLLFPTSKPTLEELIAEVELAVRGCAPFSAVLRSALACSMDTDCRTHYACTDADGDSSTECYATGDGTGVVGAACTSTASCAGGVNAICETPAGGWKNGYCTVGCDATHPCGTGSTCIDAVNECLATCSSDADCRGNGYGCVDAGGGTKVCSNLSNGTGQVGDACTGLWDCAGGTFGLCILSGYPGGCCSVLCASGQATCASGTTCIANSDIIAGESFCYKDCSSAAQCRTDYACKAPTSAVTSLECAP